MKKHLAIGLMFLMVMSIITLALAEENNTESGDRPNETESQGTDNEINETDIDNETQNEVGEMQTPHGAEVRLLQLEKAISRNIDRGQYIIDTAKNASKNVTELEAILLEMQSLLTEVQNADPSADDAVKQFVDLKSDAIELSKQFRDKAREIVGPAELGKLRTRLQQINLGNLQELQEKIKEKIKEYNVEQLQKLVSILGLDETIVEQLQNGEITVKELKSQIKQKIQSMSTIEKKDAFSKLKEEGVKRQIFKKSAIEKAKLNILARKEARLTNRLSQIGNIKDPEKRQIVQERITNRLQLVTNKEESALNGQTKSAERKGTGKGGAE